jgi:hypothetical protein
MCAAVTGTIIGAGVAGYTIYNSERQRKEAQDDLNDYERQDLENAFENIQISTMGSDLAKEEAAGNAATMIDTLQRGGTRAIFGGLPKVQEYLTGVNNQAAQYLDAQQTRRDYAAAQDNQRIRDITENRDNQNITALSSQINAGKEGVMNGVMGLGSSLFYGARAIENKYGENGDGTSGDDPFGPGNFVEKPVAKVEIIASNKSNPMNPYGNNQAMTGNIWGADPYGPEFYNKYFNV